MDRLVITGGTALRGRIRVSGAKNAALPCIAAALLTEETVTLRNLPAVADIRTMLRVLEALGCGVERVADEAGFELSAAISAQAVGDGGLQAPYDLVKTMRASILVLGPLLARFGRASVSLPGGCAIGARPVNMHLEGLERMGAAILIDKGYVEASVPGGRLKAIDHTFDKVSVGATENLLMAATLAEGTTHLRNAAVEPEIGDLARLLQAMGAAIEGIDTGTLVVHGVERLHGCEHAVIADRIEAGTYLCAVAAAGGDVVLDRVRPDDVQRAVKAHLLERHGVQAVGLRPKRAALGDDTLEGDIAELLTRVVQRQFPNDNMRVGDEVRSQLDQILKLPVEQQRKIRDELRKKAAESAPIQEKQK